MKNEPEEPKEDVMVKDDKPGTSGKKVKCVCVYVCMYVCMSVDLCIYVFSCEM